MKTNPNKLKPKPRDDAAQTAALLDLRVPKATPSDALPTQSKQPVDQSGTAPSQYVVQLALMNHQYVGDIIKFGDQKAAFVFTIVSAMLALHFNSHWFYHFLKPLAHWAALDYLYFTATYSLLVAAICAFWTVKPRLKASTPSGLVFWECVAKYATCEDYYTAVVHLTDHSAVKEIIDHQYQLSKICHSKYLYLNASVLFAGIGFVVTAFLVLVAKV